MASYPAPLTSELLSQEKFPAGSRGRLPGEWEARLDPDDRGPSGLEPLWRLETTSRVLWLEIHRGHWLCPEDEGTAV